MAVFYHVSRDVLHEGKFTPHVPESHIKDFEDSQTLRVCVSNSVDGCLSAIPKGRDSFTTYHSKNRGVFVLFTIDTEELNISEEQIVSSETLWRNGEVPDAGMTGEHWITVSFVVPENRKQVVHVTDWSEKFQTLPPLAQFLYNQTLRERGQWTKTITIGVESVADVQYQTARMKKGEIRELIVWNETERAKVERFLKSEYTGELSIIGQDKGEMLIQADKECDLFKLCLYQKYLSLKTQLEGEDDGEYDDDLW